MLKLTDEQRETARLNVAALERAWGIGFPMEASDGSANVELQEGREGRVLLRVRSPLGQWVAVHGRRPEEEADGWLREAAAGRDAVRLVVFLGAGLGFAVRSALEQWSAARVLLIEHDPALVLAFLAGRDWRSCIEQRRLAVLAGPDYVGLTTLAARLVLDDTPPLVLSHPALARARDLAPAAAAAKRVVSEGRQNLQARTAFSAPYLSNTLENLGDILRGGRVAALDGIAPGRAAVIAGAGPSLNRNIEELRPFRDKAILLAAGSAMRPLTAAGLDPDLLVALDPGEPNAWNLAGSGASGRTWLVAEGSVPPGVFREFRGRTLSFRVGDNHPWPWLLARGLDPGLLRAWGSVTTASFDLALRMGCDPIVFIGADHAYTEGQPYCRGVSWEQLWRQEQERGASLEEIWRGWREFKGIVGVPDINGVMVESSRHFIAFRDWLVQASVGASPVRVVNATGAGILRGGRVQIEPLGVVLAGQSPVAFPAGQELRRRSQFAAETRQAVAQGCDEMVRAERPEGFDAWEKDVPGFDAERVRAALAAGLAAYREAGASRT